MYANCCTTRNTTVTMHDNHTFSEKNTAIIIAVLPSITHFVVFFVPILAVLLHVAVIPLLWPLVSPLLWKLPQWLWIYRGKNYCVTLNVIKQYGNWYSDRSWVGCYIMHTLDADSAATLGHAFMTSCVDYCNAILAAAPKTTKTGYNEC